MTEITATNFMGQDLTSFAWLNRHFLSKGNRRLRQIAELPINPGAKVLDLCCGPASFTELFAMLASPGGRVVGVDHDPAHIDMADLRCERGQFRQSIEFICSDIFEYLESGDEFFDVIILFNCISYFSDPSALLERCSARLSSAGSLIVKDSDFGHFLCNRLNDTLKFEVLKYAAMDKEKSFDNFFGRRIPSLIENAGTFHASMDVWSYPMHHPLTPEEKSYISGNMLFLLDQYEKNSVGESEVMEGWRKIFDATCPEADINKPNFLFLMHEIVSIGRRKF